MIWLWMSCSREPGIPKPDHEGPLRILAVGDSITHGYGVPGGYRVPLRERLVAAGLDVDFVGSQKWAPGGWPDPEHEGWSGYLIDEIAPHAQAAVATYDPDVILLLAGCNDVRKGQGAGAPERLFALADVLHAAVPNATVIVGTLTPWKPPDPRVAAFNATLPALAEERGDWLRLADLHGAMTPEMIADDVHPDATGFAGVAAAWARAMGVR
ncbi:MAG: SGNH/GDSL hydrolase family protein [Myxococcota bacterium]